MAAIHDDAVSLIDAIAAVMTDAGALDRAARCTENRPPAAGAPGPYMSRVPSLRSVLRYVVKSGICLDRPYRSLPSGRFEPPTGWWSRATLLFGDWAKD